jgi:sec-independent protein translocase protein TatC
MLFKKAKKVQPAQVEMSFWDHLDVLRFALMRSFAVIIVFAFLAFYFTDFVYNIIILGPKNPDFISNRLFCQLGDLLSVSGLCINQTNFKLNNFEMGGQFRNNMMISLIAGLVIAMPYLLTELWVFIRPALTIKERKGVRGFVFITTFLFLLGISFGYFIITPLSIDFLSNWTLSPDIENTIKLDSYISMVVMIALSTGLVFQLPVLIYFLAKMGIVTPKFLKQYRKHAVVIIFILAAIITPPDVFSQFLVSFPLLLLYEISIMVARRVEKKAVKDL